MLTVAHTDVHTVFEFSLDDGEQLSMGSISVLVRDANTFGYDDLGCFYTDLSFVWRKNNHELYRQWVALDGAQARAK